jgi:SAM-dependent methyltransferase
MSRSERESWNQRYRRGSHHSKEPDPFLVQAFDDYIEPEFPRGGTALDLAGGVGRHAIWLARRNWKVTLVDISEVGLEQARNNAGPLASKIDFIAADLQQLSPPRSSRRSSGRVSTRRFASEFTLRRAAYDLVLGFFYLERSLFPRLVHALKPGGMLIYKTYTVDQMNLPGGPSHPLHLLKHNELLHSFKSLRVLYSRETLHDRALAEFIGKK